MRIIKAEPEEPDDQVRSACTNQGQALKRNSSPRSESISRWSEMNPERFGTTSVGEATIHRRFCSSRRIMTSRVRRRISEAEHSRSISRGSNRFSNRHRHPSGSSKARRSRKPFRINRGTPLPTVPGRTSSSRERPRSRALSVRRFPEPSSHRVGSERSAMRRRSDP